MTVAAATTKSDAPKPPFADAHRDIMGEAMTRHAVAVVACLTDADQQGVLDLFGDAATADRIKRKRPVVWERLAFAGIACEHRLAAGLCALTELGHHCSYVIRSPGAYGLKTKRTRKSRR